MIVIAWNGKVYTGWRASLIMAAGVLVAWMLFALFAFLWIGAAITIGIMMLLFVPAAIVVAIVGSMMRS